MKQYILFAMDRRLVDQDSFRELVEEILQGFAKVYFENDTRGYIEADVEEDEMDVLETLHPTLSHDFNVSMTMLIVPKRDDISLLMLEQAVLLGKGNMHTMSTVTHLRLLSKDENTRSMLKKVVEYVDHDVLETAEAFLLSGMNASKAARRLYLHRNTFNYRLNKFTEVTGMDIRQYHNAQFIYLCLLASKM